MGDQRAATPAMPSQECRSGGARRAARERASDGAHVSAEHCERPLCRHRAVARRARYSRVPQLLPRADAPLFPPPPTPSCSATAAAPRHAPRRASCARRRSPLPPRRQCLPSPWAPPSLPLAGMGDWEGGGGGWARACGQAHRDTHVVCGARPQCSARARRMYSYFWWLPLLPFSHGHGKMMEMDKGVLTLRPAPV